MKTRKAEFHVVGTVGVSLAVAVLSVASGWARSGSEGSTAATPVPASKASVVETKGCLGCHRIGGKGPTKGSDLLFASGGEWTASGFAASLWDHGPRMADHFRKLGRDLPEINPSEMELLFEELSKSRPFPKEPAGNAKAGGVAFRRAGCIGCHDEPGTASSRESTLDLKSVSSFPGLVSGLWRSIPTMMEGFGDHKRPWPKLSGRDMRDLEEYFRTSAERGKSK